MAKKKTRRPSKRTQATATKRRPPTVIRPNTLAAFLKMPAKERQNYISSTNALAKSRAEDVSLSKAARAVGVNLRTVRRWAGPALRKDKRGRWVAKKRDNLLRVLTVPGPRGTREIAVKDSRTAVHIAKYLAGVRKYIHTGDDSGLVEFRKMKLVDARGKRITLVTNRRMLVLLGHAGQFSFESLYARTA